MSQTELAAQDRRHPGRGRQMGGDRDHPTSALPKSSSGRSAPRPRPEEIAAVRQSAGWSRPELAAGSA